MLPGAALSTDILAGFPGETEKQFHNTLALVKEIRPMRVHIFPYSERPGTPAARLTAQIIDPCIVQRRMQELRAIAEVCAREFRQSLLGRDAEVLFEKRRAGSWIGHTDTYVKVFVRSAKNLKNVCCRVKLQAVEHQGMSGVLA
jgi:threonylcarbamoyladenosine tRNA methylthiotransferase MtaB